MSDAIQSAGDMALTQSMANAFVPQMAGKMTSNANIDKTSQDFESMFMSQMLQPMFQGLGVDQTFGGGHGEEVMRTFLVQEYGKVAAKGGHLGIAAAVKNEMIKAQETANKSKTSGQGGLNAVGS